MSRNGYSRISEGCHVTDVPAPKELTPQQRAARAERRRDRWEFAWSLAVLVAVVTIAVTSVVACMVLNGIAAENRRVNGLAWGAPKEGSDGR